MKKILNALFSFLGVRFRFYNDKPLKDKPFTISYALTVCTEATELTHLLLFLKPYLREHDEVIVQADLSLE